VDLVGRTRHEERFAERFARLSARHKRELKQLLGTPPDPRNIPAEFWERVKQETEEEAAALLLLILLAGSSQYTKRLEPAIAQSGRDIGQAALQIEQQLRQWADARATEFSQQYTERSQEIVNRLGLPGEVTGPAEQPAAQPGAGGTGVGQPGSLPVIQPATQPPTQQPAVQPDPDEIIDQAFGPNRVENIAVTETTGAASAAGEIAVDATVGRNEEDRWFTAEDQRVCPICAPLNGKTRSNWSRFFPDGPPAHPRCRCWIEYAFEQVGAGAGGLTPQLAATR